MENTYECNCSDIISLQLELGDNYIALKDAYVAIITAEKMIKIEKRK